LKRNIGFSTGSLARGDFKRAISILQDHKVDVIELSALREPELPLLLQALEDGLDLSQFKQISFHAPSKFVTLDAKTLCEMLQPIVARKWSIVVHPDMIQDPAPWRTLGHHLCIENSDPRKPVGRTATEMLPYFEMLPQASWCFDIAHVQQVDHSMSVAVAMLANFSDRLREIHLSRIDIEGKHWALDAPMIQACRRIAQRISPNVPIILEAVIPPQAIPDELLSAAQAMGIEATNI